MMWTPIEDLPAEADEWIGQDYLAERARWHEASTALWDPALDRSILDLWTEERHRLSAIETGQIENLYTMRLGMTEMLIAEGLENARSSHTVEGVLDDRTLRGLLRDQRDAMDMVFRTVKVERRSRRASSRSGTHCSRATRTPHRGSTSMGGASGFRF